MKFLLAGFVLVSIAFGCTVEARPNINNLGGLLNQLSQLHGVLDHLDDWFPQIHQILSSSEFSSFKDKVTQVILAGIASNGGISGITAQLQGIIQQVPQVYPTGRINWDALLNNFLNGVVSAVPQIALGLLGKRDVNTDDLSARNLQQLYNLVDKLNLNTLIPQIQGLLNGPQLQQMQTQFFNMMGGLFNGNLPSANVLGGMIQSLVSQFLPSANLMRIDWEHLGNQALNGLVSALPSIAVGLISLFGKRDLPQERINFQQLLATLPVDKIAKLVATILNNHNGHVTNVLTQLDSLLQQFFPQYQGRIDFEQLTSMVFNTVVNNLPALGISFIQSLFGKRDINQLVTLISSIDITHLIPQIQHLISNINLQQLQSQFMTLVINALANHMDIKELGQQIQVLVMQFLPSANLMRIDWEHLGNQALNGLVSALPSIAVGLLSLFG